MAEPKEVWILVPKDASPGQQQAAAREGFARALTAAASQQRSSAPSTSPTSSPDPASSPEASKSTP